mmetsp:Transcript_24957/g.57655  ORF Transcript_24957/g.57655 Transcript_24957/m.57655 type:complete len:182 (+) Transcript_24957:122-667(+)
MLLLIRIGSFLSILNNTNSLVFSTWQIPRSSTQAILPENNPENDETLTRRSLISNAVGIICAAPFMYPLAAIPATADSNVGFFGLTAEEIGEPSISYKDFLAKLTAGEVSFVEFLAPDGDVAYATFKPLEGEEKSAPPIRIGEGYPIEQHDGLSSPAFAIRNVKERGVPYKFVVKGLEAYK